MTVRKNNCKLILVCVLIVLFFPFSNVKAANALNISCTSEKVKSQFSCENLKIVENHMYDLNADNFESYIKSKGGFEAYARSLGGVFGEYYGKKITGRTEYDYQMAAEYVLGWMYMYGWDYKNGFEPDEGEHMNWGGRDQPYAPDAFYYNTRNKWERKYVPDYDPYSAEFWAYGTDFDHVISGKNGGVGAMASECGDLEAFIHNKLGNTKANEFSVLRRLRDLKVGDSIYYLNQERGFAHNAVVGEVYSDHIVIYDGAFMTESPNMNFKRPLYYPKEDTAAADLEAVQSVVLFPATEWFGRRFYNLEKTPIINNGNGSDGGNDSRFFCELCTKKKGDPLYKKEQQFYNKVNIIKQVFGDRIDEVVLASTVLHRYGQDYVYNKEYTENYSEESYRSMWSDMYSSITSGLTKLLVNEEDEKRIKENEKIDLLTLAAIVMIDSNSGQYSDVCYKDGLAGEGLVGNTGANPAFAALENGLFCGAYELTTGLDLLSPMNFAYRMFVNEDSFLVTGLSGVNRFANIKKVCEKGYIGGLYSDVSHIKDSDKLKRIKNRRAQEIIDFANYYKFHYGTLEETSEVVNTCPIGGVNGNTQGSDLKGTREKRIQQIGPAAQAVYSNSGVFASVTIAQAIQESDIGAAGTYGVNNNNLFGVKCRDGKECRDGYAVFNSIEESIEDRVKMFDNGMYPDWKSATTPEDFIRRIGPVYCPADDGCGDYAGTIIQLINEYDLKKWDVKANVSTNSNCGISGSSGGWDLRTIKPMSSDKSFTEMESVNGNNSNRGQCVWYARGRAYEIVNSLKDKGNLTDSQASHIKKLLAEGYGNGGDIYGNAKSVFNSSNDVKKPKAGSYIVWKKPGSWGHVAIVEEVNTASNTITITGGYTSTGSCPGDWGCVEFETKTMSLDAFYEGYGKYYSGGYIFSGYVYFLEPLDMKDAWGAVSESGTTCNKSGNVIADLAVATASDAQTKKGEDVHIYEPNAYPWNKVNDPKLSAFFEVMDAVYHEGDNKAYASCAQAAAAIIRATVDPDFETVNPQGQSRYLKDNTEKWEHVGTLKAGDKVDEKCQPGDILNTTTGWNHTLIYVGNEATKSKFKNSIGNIWQAGYTEGDHAKYPAIDYVESFPVSFEIYRPTGKGEFKNEFIDISKYVDNSNICNNESQNLTCENGVATSYDDNVNISGNLNFSCKSDKVKSDFSCDTLKIVENHLYDFDATNFNEKIKSYGGFDAYVNSLGGIFSTYYGKKMPHETESDFQRAAEYVLGWMYMYGWDYMSYGGRHEKCSGDDCFYAKGGFEGKYVRDSGVGYAGLGVGNNIDNIVSGKNGGPGRMASECGDIESFTFNKLDIKMENYVLQKFTRLKDVKVGDVLCMWNSSGGEHVVIIGEVYNDHIVIYDAGAHYPTTRNFKRPIYFSKNDSVDGDREVLKKEFKYYDSWGTRRHYDFKKG